MARYIALLRGVNVGGNNIINMAELKAALGRQGFTDVVTYINSGNILFGCENADEAGLKATLEERITADFRLSLTVCVISAADLREAIAHAPAWWNDPPDPSMRHNAFFVIPPMTAPELIRRVGATKPEYEKVAYFGRVIFWSAPMATFSRTTWSKISKALHGTITVRNANTTLKLAELAGRETNG